MKTQKHTEEGLPIIVEDVVNVLIRDMIQRENEGEKSKKNFSEEVMERIKKTNPGYYSLCNDASIRFSLAETEIEKENNRAYLLGLEVGYEVLRRQAEINNLD